MELIMKRKHFEDGEYKMILIEQKYNGSKETYLYFIV